MSNEQSGAALPNIKPCKRCDGKGFVDDGEITHSEGGIPYENGPVKCVKDCPVCTRRPPMPQQAENFWPVDAKASRMQLIAQIGQMNFRLTALRNESAGLVRRVKGQATELRSKPPAQQPEGLREAEPAGPQPMTEAPPVGTICWLPFYEFNNWFEWMGIPGSFQEQWLKDGKVFRSEADALAVLRAALAATPVREAAEQPAGEYPPLPDLTSDGEIWQAIIAIIEHGDDSYAAHAAAVDTVITKTLRAFADATVALRTTSADRAARAAPTQVGAGVSREYVLRAMSRNYTAGHVWDHLDADACEEGADEIKQLRAALAAQGGQEAEPTGLAAPLRLVVKKLERFDECAEDSDSGGCDIGRPWFDTLTHLGLLDRTQRSPAEWTMTPVGHDLLRTGGFTHPPRTQGDADRQDAARWREALVHVGGDRNAAGRQSFILPYLRPAKGSNLMKGSVVEHFTKAIDAAIARQGGKDGEA